MERPGKIYLHENYIFVNEVNKGIHIFDNTNPSSPVPMSFLEIGGAMDMAVKDQTLYVDNYIDLVSINIADISNPQFCGRVENVFPAEGPMEDGKILVAYDLEDVTEKVTCADDSWRTWAVTIEDEPEFENPTLSATAAGGGRANTGIAGSMSRFALYRDFLYAVGTSEMWLFDISNRCSPSNQGEINLANNWNVETIFPYQNNLFIGTSGGMLIYNVNNPNAPSFRSDLPHTTSCDPVFVQDEIAYVTLRNGNRCDGWTNQLDVVDVSDVSNPRLLRSFNMVNPHGLSIRDNHLFICEGDHGFKAYDITNPERIDRNLLSFERDIQSFDVISVPGTTGTIMIVGKDGLYQYDASDPENMVQLSYLPVQ